MATVKECQLLVTVMARPTLDRVSLLISNRFTISRVLSLACSFAPDPLSEPCEK